MTDWVQQWQHAVNELTPKGLFGPAEAAIREARKHFEGNQYYQSGIDLADTLRKPSQYEEALQLVREAVDHFDSIGDERGLADALQHLARVQRRLGLLDEAMASVSQALARVRRFNRQRHQLGKPIHPGQVWIELDYASIAAMLGYPGMCRSKAFAAMRTMRQFRRTQPDPKIQAQINRTHWRRAIVLFLFAGKGSAKLKFVRTARMGRSA